MEKENLEMEILSSLRKRNDLPEEVMSIIEATFKTYEEKIEHLQGLVITDALTELYNRRHFDESLEGEIERSTRHNHPLSLIMLDVDDFKKYNDCSGHPEGDKVLVEIGSTIKSHVRKIDTLCRYGGEEFVVILPETIKDDVVNLAERIRKGIWEKIFYSKEKKVHVSASFGIAEYIENESAKEFVKRADSRLYQAKENGKNQVCFD